MPAAPGGASRPVVVRRATVADAAAIERLFEVRRQTDEATAAGEARGPDLDNPLRKLWLALDGDTPLGMTSVQERVLAGPAGDQRVAYWTGLFVDPAHRSEFVYPQLMLAMLKGLRAEGIRHLYAAVRRQQVAEGHIKMGFRKIGDIPVLVKPLRPFTLLARHRRLLRPDGTPRALALLLRLPDALVGAAVAVQCALGGGRGAEPGWTPAVLRALGELAGPAGATAVSQRWDADALARRYAAMPGRYRLLTVPGAAVVVRIADRPDGIRALVVMDLLHAPGAEHAAGRAFAAAESLALREGCDVALYLDGLSAALARAATRRGFVRSPEKYTLLLWRDRGAPEAGLPDAVRGWRFAFGDHDTF